LNEMAKLHKDGDSVDRRLLATNADCPPAL
jgi:hypothetical protein